MLKTGRRIDLSTESSKLGSKYRGDDRKKARKREKVQVRDSWHRNTCRRGWSSASFRRLEVSEPTLSSAELWEQS